MTAWPPREPCWTSLAHRAHVHSAGCRFADIWIFFLPGLAAGPGKKAEALVCVFEDPGPSELFVVEPA